MLPKVFEIHLTAEMLFIEYCGHQCGVVGLKTDILEFDTSSLPFALSMLVTCTCMCMEIHAIIFIYT